MQDLCQKLKQVSTEANVVAFSVTLHTHGVTQMISQQLCPVVNAKGDPTKDWGVFGYE